MVTARECLAYIESTGISRCSLAKEFDCAYTTLYRIAKGDIEQPRTHLLEKILKKYVERKKYMAELDRLSKGAQE